MVTPGSNCAVPSGGMRNPENSQGIQNSYMVAQEFPGPSPLEPGAMQPHRTNEEVRSYLYRVLGLQYPNSNGPS